MNNEDNPLIQARHSIQAGNLQEALAILEKGADAENGMTQEEFAFLLWRCFEFDRARDVFNELCSLPNTPVLTIQQIARCYFQTGRFREAAEAMQFAVDRADRKNHAQCLEQFAICLERDNRQEEGIEIARQALTQNPESARAVRLLAHIDKRERRYEDAISKLTNHLTKYPGSWDWELRYELAASLDRIGEYDRAWSELESAKFQLANATRPQLKASYTIRKRQGEFARAVTDVDLKNWFEPVGKPDLRIALLAGFPRSGTTLLEQILAAHVDCVGTDETEILSSQFVKPIVWDAERAFDALLEMRMLDNQQLVEGRAAYLRFTENYVGDEVKQRLLIEKDPLMTSDLLFRLRLFPEASLIMPLRDPRDVAISYFFTMVPLNWNSAPATSIIETARFYHDCMRHWLLFRDRIPWPHIETRYEAIVRDELSETKRLTEFLGLSWDPGILDTANRSQQKAISTPTYDDITQPIYDRAVNRWKNYRRYLEPALNILEPIARAFDYE